MINQHFIKKLTPVFVRNLLRIKRDRAVEAEFSGLTNKEIFEKIYEEKRWGSPEKMKRNYSSGDGSRDPELVENYVKSIVRFLKNESDLVSALDLGCGDFSVGSKIFPHFEKYIAADVASNVIEENKMLFKDNKLDFVALNMTEDELPHADVIFVRQALQHLCNAEIKKFLQNVKGKYKYLIITESISNSSLFSPNKDIVSGPGIRIHKKSGVVIEEPPFNFKAKAIETILEYPKGKELFVTKVYSAMIE